MKTISRIRRQAAIERRNRAIRDFLVCAGLLAGSAIITVMAIWLIGG